MNTKGWKSAVAALGCIVCAHFDIAQAGRTCLHHARSGQGMSQRASDFLVIPLCFEHHQGKSGVHGGEFYQRFKLDELDLLAMTIEGVAKGVNR